MNLRVDDNERVFLAIKKSQQGDYTLQAKRRYKKKASVHVLHLPAWLLQLYKMEVLTKLAPEV